MVMVIWILIGNMVNRKMTKQIVMVKGDVTVGQVSKIVTSGFNLKNSCFSLILILPSM